MNRKLINYLPFIVRNYAEFQGITWAEQPEFENAWASVEKILANQFVRTADNLGLSRWEKILGIVPKGTDTLDGRRFRILARLNERLPYTLPRFRQMLESLCGTGNTSAEIATGTYRLRIWIVEEVLEYLPELRSLTARIVPVNLSCFYEVQMESVQLFNFNIFELVNLKICGRVNNWGMEIARFNGRHLFDGSIRFDQQVHRDNLLGLEIRGLKWQTRETMARQGEQHRTAHLAEHPFEKRRGDQPRHGFRPEHSNAGHSLADERGRFRGQRVAHPAAKPAAGRRYPAAHAAQGKHRGTGGGKKHRKRGGPSDLRHSGQPYHQPGHGF